MQSSKNSGSTPRRLPLTKPNTSSDSGVLTSSELEQLRRVANKQIEFARQAFGEKPGLNMTLDGEHPPYEAKKANS